jgi:glycerophosphoryl diester phosphodiesterase
MDPMESLRDDAFGPGGAIRIVGHRGAAGAAPENTLPGLEHAVDVGADAVEFDLQATRDGRLVLLHDATVDRTTDGAGAVEEMALDEVRELDAGHAFTPDRGRTFPFRGDGVRVPTLEEAMEATRGVPVVAEAKSGPAGRLLADWMEGREDGRRMLVGGFALADTGDAARHARWRCASKDELRPYVLLGKLGLGRWFVPEAHALMVPERHRLVSVVTRRFVRRAHGDGLGVHVWTVNRPSRMRRLLDTGVDGLVTDLPGRARRVLDEREVWG